jgi:uncharacterized membrane protein YeaQ/YmgE (transglycosylase-associated protein family)
VVSRDDLRNLFRAVATGEVRRGAARDGTVAGRLFREEVRTCIVDAHVDERARFAATGRGQLDAMEILLLVLVAVVVLVVVAILVVGFVLKLLWWVLIGLALGVLARAVLPGRQEIGFLRTAGAGIAAALLGGVIAHAAGVGSILQFVIAAAVAIVLVAILSGYERATA